MSKLSVPPAGAPGRLREELVRDYAARLYGYAYRLCGDRNEAEDLTQQTFLVACRNLEQLREPEKAAAWLFSILRRTYWKSRRKRRELSESDADYDIGEQPAAPQSEELPLEFDEERLQNALNELPEPQRVVLVMFYFEELSYQQLAEALEIPPGTVMSRLARAKERLRQKLQTAETVRSR